MPQDKIDLQCPACKTMLELDVGFAGGVCRCFKCATLMTVPADPQRGKAETLRRPDRPDAPPGTRPAAPGAPLPEVDQATDDEQGAQTFVTSTGRVVTIDDADHIPTALKKRTGVRVATVAAFVGTVVLVVVLTVVAILAVVSQPPAPTGTDLNDPTVQATLMFSYDPRQNPMTIAQPNVMGLPLSLRTSVLIDTAGMDEATRTAVAKLVAEGLSHPVPKVSVLVAGTGEGTPRTFAGGAQALEAVVKGDLLKFLQAPVGEGAKLDDAGRAALRNEPGGLVIITGRRIGAEQAASLAKLLQEQEKLVVDVVMIGPPSVALEDIAKAKGGRAITLSRSGVAEWSSAAPAAR